MVGGLIHLCTIQRRYPKQRLTHTDGGGTPKVGQTLTGAASTKTAVISAVGDKYLVLKDLTGNFTLGETVSTPTWSGKVSSQADYENQSGEPGWYWLDDQTRVLCRFYGRDGKGRYRHDVGDLEDQLTKFMLHPSATVEKTHYRISTTQAGFSGTYAIIWLLPLSNSCGLDHYEAGLKGVL